MQRFHQLLFAVSLLLLSWFAMMAVHELGHIVGAIVTGGSIQGIVLNPLTISRTDVSPNPHPSIVVWLGPVVGSMLPLAMFAIVPKHLNVLRNVARFFAGFCLIANGAYISIGSFYRVGDCGEMLQTGTPLWAMLTFGAITIPLGLTLWHGLGSLNHFIHNPSV
jgi:mannose/fructose/N-acetylgalactosamine-specific phosphotransferase system component IIC